MKKLVTLFLVLLSVGLYSQEPKYWEKIDFEFDSGIKQIDFAKPLIENKKYIQPYIILTDNNSIYFFSKFNNQGEKIISEFQNGVIKEANIIYQNQDTNSILILTDDQHLFITKDMGMSFVEINDEIENSKVNTIDKSGNIFWVGTEESGAFYCDVNGKSWKNFKTGIENKKILEMHNSYHGIFCLTNENQIFRRKFNMNIKDYIWETYKTSDLNDRIHDFEIGYEGSLIFIDESNNLVGDNIQSFNGKNVTCFSSFELRIPLFNMNIAIPWNIVLIIGTELNGLWGCDWDSHGCKFGNELLDEIISDIEVNDVINPDLCLVGTKKGELYYSRFYVNAVQDNSTNELHTQISPQPACTKARLSFNLPSESNISVKVFNALGMQMMSIADGYFKEGENSIPLDVSGLSDGMYFVAIQYDGSTVVEKLVVKK